MPPPLAQLITQSALPLLVTRDPTADTAPFQRVLAPIDFSRHAQHGLAHAKLIAELYGATLDVLHVLERPPYVALNTMDLLALSDAQLPERRALRRARALLNNTTGPPFDARFHVTHGDPAQEITAFARNYENDLVVLSSHGSTGQSQHPVGTVAEKLIRRLDIPFFLVRSFGTSLVSPPDACLPDPP